MFSHLYIREADLAYMDAQQIMAAHPDIGYASPFEPPPGYAHSVEVLPPPFDAGTHQALMAPPEQVDGQWHWCWSVQPLDADETLARTAALREQLQAAVTERRWEVETGGVTLPGGVRVATGTADQNRIATVISTASLAGVATVEFKAASGWVTLTLDEVRGIAAGIALHVQACFAAERAHHEAIAATGLSDLVAYDVMAGWPA